MRFIQLVMQEDFCYNYWQNQEIFVNQNNVSISHF